MELTEFLNERLGEDEEDAGGMLFDLGGGNLEPRVERAKAEVEAKRRIMEEHGAQEVASLDRATRGQMFIVCRRCAGVGGRQVIQPCPTLRMLALPYADHPDWREEWRP